jgi:DNA invertase Pin-like site-specific DNA recombinase
MIEAYGYLRVSARNQGPRGFGLAAQKCAVIAYCKSNKIKLVKIFSERGSGLNNERPIVNRVINLCRKYDRVLVVPRQSRLSRDALFVLTLIAEKFKYTNVDSPHANNFQKRIQAVFDQEEAEKIQDNTRRSLKSAADKGVKLGGNPQKQKRTLKRKKRDYLKKNRVRFRTIQREYTTIRARTKVFNRLRIKKLNGKRGGWNISEVHGIYRDLSKLK